MILTSEQVRTLKHSLGLDRAKESYRNHYAAPPEGDSVCESLVTLGLMRKGDTVKAGYGCQMYHVTAAGEALFRQRYPWLPV